MKTWEKLSRAERDAAFNNSAAVAESARLNEGRAAASAGFRAVHAAHLDLAYGPRPRNKWDLYPASDPAAPCFVFIHGGYWQRNRREDFACLVAGICAHGWSAALPGYTLAPEATLTEIVTEIHTALDWLGAHGKRHGIAGPVVLSGWSAGGHLAAMALAHPLVAAGMGISGVYELGPLRDTYLDEKLRLTDAEIGSLSPTRLPPVGKMFAVAYGSAEIWGLVDSSRDFHAWRSAHHAPGALIPVSGADHFTIVEGPLAKDGELTREILGLV